MEIKQTIRQIIEHKSLINMLQGIMYKDIYLNEIGIRVLGIHYMDNGPDWHVNMHRHSFYEFHYVLKDNVFSNINNVEYDVKEGQFYILAPGTFHSHRQDGRTGHIGIALRWEFIGRNTGNTEIKLRESLESKFYSNVEPTIDDGDIANGLLNLFIKARNMYMELSPLIAFGQFVTDLAQYISCSDNNLHLHVNHNFLDNNIVNTAMKFIDENFDQDIDVNDVANAVHLSYSHLSRLFRDYSDESINSYICRVRLQKARYYLKCTNEDISSIARKVGFNSENYFCNIFKKNIGVSASHYRKLKGNLD